MLVIDAGYKSKEWLEAKYHGEGLSSSQIAKLCGVGRRAIDRWLNIHGIRRKYPRNGHRISVPRETLERLYCQEKLTIREMAKVLGMADRTVLSRMEELRVPRRSCKDASALRKDFTNHIDITGHTKEVLDGELLGNGNVTPNGERSAAFQYGTSKEDYARWLLARLRSCGFKTNEVEGRKTGRGYWAWFFRTQSYPELREYRERWYPAGGKKTVPRDIELTPTVCLHWYIGDGHLKKRLGYIVLSTNAFDLKEVDFLAAKLRSIVGNVTSHSARGKRFPNQRVVAIHKRSVPDFLDYIGACPKEIEAAYGYKWRVA